MFCLATHPGLRRSSTTATLFHQQISCAVPRTHNTFGDRSFAVAGPCVWNSLSAHLSDEDIRYDSFRRELKTLCYARQHICYSAYYAICLSVCPSVTRVDHTKTVEVRITNFSPYGSPIPLVFREQVSFRNSDGFPQSGGAK